MEFRENVRSAVKQSAEERNAQHVYVRCNYRRVTVPDADGTERIEWQYDEYYMTDNEYENIRAGRLFGIDEWSDALRGVERSYLYDHADKYIMKARTDAPNPELEAALISYKAAIRATVNQPTYPQTVVYPEPPI